MCSCAGIIFYTSILQIKKMLFKIYAIFKNLKYKIFYYSEDVAPILGGMLGGLIGHMIGEEQFLRRSFGKHLSTNSTFKN